MSTTRQASGALWQRIGPLLGLATLFVGLSFASPYFLTVDNLLNVLRQSSINAILALGQLVVIITAGIDLSIGSVVGVTIVALALMLVAGWHPVTACAVAIAIGVGIGLLNGLLLTKLRLPHPFISTLGTMNVGARARRCCSPAACPSAGFPAVSARDVAGTLLGIPMPVVIAALAYVVGARVPHPHGAGAATSTRSAAIARRRGCAGIPVDRRLNLAYALSGAAAASAAIVLAARMNSGFPLAGTGAELDAIAAVIIGGASFFGGRGHGGRHADRRADHRVPAQRPQPARRLARSGR